MQLQQLRIAAEATVRCSCSSCALQLNNQNKWGTYTLVLQHLCSATNAAAQSNRWDFALQLKQLRKELAAVLLGNESSCAKQLLKLCVAIEETAWGICSSYTFYWSSCTMVQKLRFAIKAVAQRSSSNCVSQLQLTCCVIAAQRFCNPNSFTRQLEQLGDAVTATAWRSYSNWATQLQILRFQLKQRTTQLQQLWVTVIVNALCSCCNNLFANQNSFRKWLDSVRCSCSNCTTQLQK